MDKLSLNEYLKAPCRKSSIPYWKRKALVVPDDMLILHDADFFRGDYKGYTDERYFRLFHDLKTLRMPGADGAEIVVAADRTDAFVSTINGSYSDLSVTERQLESYQKTPVYCPELWLLLRDGKGKYIGSGIADYDREAGELIIEWVQVLPLYRNRGYGSAIVNALLTKMKGRAKFATVSGKLDSPVCPEKLYRKCGFKGNDIWHILRKI